ncbi:hypothetical protein Tco_1271338, partial [Tanacetum coccineum]
DYMLNSWSQEIQCDADSFSASNLRRFTLSQNDSFFWVDASIFPLSIPWHTKKTLTWDPSPTATEFNAEACDLLATHQALFRKFPEPFLCLVGISRYYDLDDNVYPTFLTATEEEIDLFSFIHHADPTKVRISERKIEEGHVPLFESTKGRLIPLAGGNKQGNQNDNVQDVGPHDLNEESGDAEQENHSKGGDHTGQDEMITIAIDEEVQVVAVDKPKGTRKKRKVTLVLGLLEHSTLALEISATVATTVPFVTSSMTLTPEGEGNAGVTSIVRSPIPPPSVMTLAVATTAVAGTSFAPILRAGPELVHASIFTDSASPSAVGLDTARPSNPCGTEIFANTFYVSQEMDSKTLQQIYVPKWNITNNSTLDDPEFNVGAARQTCLNAKVRLWSEHNYKEKKKFEKKCQRQTDLLKEKDDEIASLKSQLSLKEAEAIQEIRLYSQVSIKGELNSLRERNTALEAEKSALEGQVATLESMIVIKDTELASFNTQITKLTQDLSNFQLSCDELSIKATSLESERDMLVDQVSSLEGTCSGLRDQVSGYKIFKEQCDAV